MRSHVLFAIGLLLLPAGAQGQDRDIDAAYVQLYAGQPETATAHFERLRTEQHDALAPWFGELFSTMLRLDHDESLAPRFERSIDAFLEQATARYRRSAADTDALFYLTQGHLLRGTYRFAHDKGIWGAARDGARAKSFAEDYVKRHPEHGDAYLALGLYNYFVDIAPSFVKVLRVLLFLPAGDRAAGLAQLERASGQGSRFAPLAQTALIEIYGTFESRPRDGIALAQRYLERFPQNLEMRLNLAALHMHSTVENFALAEQELSTVLATATSASTRHQAQRHTAILGLASLRRTEWRIDEAIALLTGAIGPAPAKPQWILPTFLLRRGNYKMLINDPSALVDVRRVLADQQMKRWHEPAQQLVRAHNDRQQSDEGVVYAALIPGNRLVAEDRFDAARDAYEKVAARHPGDWQLRYRFAYLEFARGRYDAARSGMQSIVTSTADMPDWLEAAALLHLAYTHDLAGQRDEAVKLYRRIVDKYEDDGSATAARLGMVSPYRGR